MLCSEIQKSNRFSERVYREIERAAADWIGWVDRGEPGLLRRGDRRGSRAGSAARGAERLTHCRPGVSGRRGAGQSDPALGSRRSVDPHRCCAPLPTAISGVQTTGTTCGWRARSDGAVAAGDRALLRRPGGLGGSYAAEPRCLHPRGGRRTALLGAGGTSTATRAAAGGPGAPTAGREHPLYLGSFLILLAFCDPGRELAGDGSGRSRLPRSSTCPSIRIEEQLLAAQYGDRWRRYCQRTWAFLPRCWGRPAIAALREGEITPFGFRRPAREVGVLVLILMGVLGASGALRAMRSALGLPQLFSVQAGSRARGALTSRDVRLRGSPGKPAAESGNRQG